MELIKNLLALREEQEEQFAGFSEDHVRDLESRIGEQIDDNPEIKSIIVTRETYKFGQPIYHAVIMFDGKDDKGYRGNVYFVARPISKGQIEDFKIVDITGRGYRKVPDSIND